VWPVSRLIDDRLQKANVEIWGVYDALKEMQPWWQTVTFPMIYMQGELDELVDPRNLDFAENFLPTANTRVVRIPDQGHLVHRQQQVLIAELVLELLSKTEHSK
jgi:pimeloyl-ACP methyl ester carboxylesterase